MPVTKSAKTALRTATGRHEENIVQRAAYKPAVIGVKKAATAGEADTATLTSKAQSALDRAAKNHTIHPNKAARLKSRLAKKLVVLASETPKAEVKKATKAKAATKTKTAAKSKAKK